MSYLPVPTPSKPQIITTRCGMPTNIISATSTIRSEVRQRLYVGSQVISQIQIAAGGYIFASTGGGLMPYPNDYDYEAAIEILSPTCAFEFTWEGDRPAYNKTLENYHSRLKTVPTGADIILSNPLSGISIPAGGNFWLRHAISVPNQSCLTPWWLFQTNIPSGDAVIISPNSNSQVFGTGAFTTPPGGSTYTGIIPLLMLGIPVAPMVSVVMIGDSIGNGTGDTVSALGSCGFIARGLESVGPNNYPVPYARITLPGWLAAFASNVLLNGAITGFYKYTTHIFIELGTNDISNGYTLSQLQGYITILAQNAKNVIGPYGKPPKVAISTILPRTTSTDNFTTLTNQTPNAGYTVGSTRDQFNAWLLTQVGLGLIDTVVDPCQYIESQSTPGVWIVNGTANYATADGIHPTPAAAILAARAVTTWASTITP